MDAPLFMIPLWADLTAVGLGGIQGALFASGFRGQRRLDLLGVAIIGIVMGMGGGIIRDTLLDQPLSTLQSNWYLLTATGAALVGMLLAAPLRRLNSVIVGLDAIVIGLFAHSVRARPWRSVCRWSRRSSSASARPWAAASCETCS